ncbi:MAG: hypothetical protein AAF698_05445 [Pseudomonadota bacterium]
MPRRSRGRYHRIAFDKPCPHCPARLRIGASKTRQLWLFVLVVLPATIATMIATVIAAMELGFPHEGSYLERAPMIIAVGVPLVLLPMILIIRLHGVQRTG